MICIKIKPVNPREASVLATVICPVTNMAGRLQVFEKWIKEVSTHSHIETFVIHDFADEATGNELELICAKLQNVYFIEGRFGNPGSARNIGLRACKGEWITFWDCDDEPNIPKFLRLLESVVQDNSDICIANYNIRNEINGTITEKLPWSGDFKEDIRTFALNPGIWRIIFNKKVINKISFNPLKMAEDQIFICEAMLNANSVKFVNDRIYTYFIGSLNHLTKNKVAQQDLLPAMQRTNSLSRRNHKLDLVPLLNLMSARQFISGMKHGNTKTRFGLLVTSFRHGLIFRRIYLESLKQVLNNSSRGA
jgi:glycosyltransferase involved in cell wall biosynthesis